MCELTYDTTIKMAENSTTDSYSYNCSIFYNYHTGPSSKRSQDQELSLKFVTELNNELVEAGLDNNYYYDKVMPGGGFFEMLADMIKLSDKIVVVLTEGFINNELQTYGAQLAFTSLIESGDTQKIVWIAIGLDKGDIPNKFGLRSQMIIYFNDEWKDDKTAWGHTVRRFTQNYPIKESAASSTKQEDKKVPEIFITYQWDIQEKVKVLYNKLTELGYHCWMDIHQIVAGQSLYNKIDQGMRGCQLVLSCVTKKYTDSHNCRREVSLADSLKRPIVPLLLEKITWPPEGPMSMAFTGLLYKNFHSDEEVEDIWTGSKFDELMASIRNYIPREDAVEQLSMRLEQGASIN